MTACTHYAPAPVDPAAFPQAFDARALDLAPQGGAEAGSHLALLAQALRFSPSVRQHATAYASAEASAQAARQGPVAGLTLLTEYANDAATSSPWLVGAGADIPVDVGPRRALRRAAAERSVLTALYDYGEAIWSVRSALKHAEIERAAAVEESALLDRLVGLRRRQVAVTEARVSAGESPRIEAARAGVELAAAAQRLDASRARRSRAEATIAAAIGVPGSALTDLPAERLPAALPAPPPAGELQSARGEAALTRADVLRGIVAYAQSEDDLRLEIAKQYPELRLQPGYTWERGLSKFPFNLALTLPPSDLNRANIARAEAVRSEAGRRLEALQAGVLSAADGATGALRLSVDAAGQAQARQAMAARRVRSLTEAGLRGGEADRLEWIADQAAELETEIAAVDARRLAWDALAALEDALHRPFDPRETALVTQAAQQPIRRSS